MPASDPSAAAYNATISAGGSAYDILVIGAGFAGSVFCAHLINKLTKPHLIGLLDKKDHGYGQMFRPRSPVMTFPYPAKELSAFSERPDHFVQWLKSDAGSRALYECGLKHETFDRESCVPRRIYGEYLTFVLREARYAAGATGSRLDLLQREATEIRKDPEVNGLFYVKTDNNEILRAKKIILAVGTEASARLPGDFPEIIQDFYHEDMKPHIEAIKKDEKKSQAPILIYGRAARAADALLSLRIAGYEGMIVQFAPETEENITDLTDVSPEIAAFLDLQIHAGVLRIVNAELYDMSEYEGRFIVRTENKVGKLSEYLPALLVNAAAPETRLTKMQNPLIRSLAQFGALTPDPSGNGIALRKNCIPEGVFAREDFFTIGALTAGAVPDITIKGLRENISRLCQQFLEA